MKKTLLAAVPALLAALLLWSCTPQTGEEPSVLLWFAGNTAEWSSDTRAVDSIPYGGQELTVDGLMTALLAGPPQDSHLHSPFPAGTCVQDWQLDQSGLLRLDLSGEYAVLAGLELTVADYCIALTLSQLPGVECVSITADGRQISRRYRQELSGGQVILSGAEEEPVELSADLYFPRTAGRGLGLETRIFHLTEGEMVAEAVTLALLGGPRVEELSPVIPVGTQLLSVKLEDGVCTLDFSGEFLSGMPESEEGQLLVIYAIADTLGNLDTVDSVVLQAEGETLTEYGSVVLPEPLEPDFGLADSG